MNLILNYYMNKKMMIATFVTIVAIVGAYFVGSERQKCVDNQLMKMKLDVMYAMMANTPEDAFVDIDTQSWAEDENIEFWVEEAKKIDIIDFE